MLALANSKDFQLLLMILLWRSYIPVSNHQINVPVETQSCLVISPPYTTHMLTWDGIAMLPCVSHPFVSVPFGPEDNPGVWLSMHACWGRRSALAHTQNILFFHVHSLSPSPYSSPPQICNFSKLWVRRLETWAVMPGISCLLLWTHNSRVSRCFCPSWC